MKALLLIALGAVAWGQNSVGLPCLGKIVDRFGNLRSLCGVSGGFLLSDASEQTAISVGFSYRGGWIKTANKITVLDDGKTFEAEAPDGTALFAFRGDGSPAFAYFQATREMIQWNGESTKKVEVPVEIEVVSLGVTAIGGWLVLAKRPEGGLFVLSENGREADREGLSGLVINGERSLTYFNGMLRLGEMEFAMDSAPQRMEWINPEWLHLGGVALRITPGREALYVLPEAN
jgi:hypothetical protein